MRSSLILLTVVLAFAPTVAADSPAPHFADAQAVADTASGGGMLYQAEPEIDHATDLYAFWYWRSPESLIRRVEVTVGTRLLHDARDIGPNSREAARLTDLAAAIPATTISFADALAAACDAAPGTLVEIRLKLDGGAVVYEVKLADGLDLYTITVDPETGDVLHVEPGMGGTGMIDIFDALLLAEGLVDDGIVVSAGYDCAARSFVLEVLDPALALIRRIEYDADNGMLIADDTDAGSSSEYDRLFMLLDGVRFGLTEGVAIAQAALPGRDIAQLEFDELDDGTLAVRAVLPCCDGDDDEGWRHDDTWCAGDDGDRFTTVLIDADTGAIIDITGDCPAQPGLNPGLVRSIEAALAMHPGAVALASEIKTGAPRARYEVELVDPTTLELTHLTLSPGSSRLLGSEPSAPGSEQQMRLEAILALLPDAVVTYEDALLTARRYHPQGQPRRVELDIEDDLLVYRVGIRIGNRWSDVLVDVIDGTVGGAAFHDAIRCDPDDEPEHARVSSAGPGGGRVGATYVTGAGRLVLLELDPVTGQWFATLLDDRGGLVTEPVSSAAFTDQKEDRAFVSVVTRGGLVLIDPQRDASEDRNLTAELPGATPIVDKQTTFTSIDGLTFIAGLDPAGDLVLYFQTNEVRTDGEQVWAFANLSRDHLRPQGLDTPAFGDALISYVTSWNGLNIAGLDPSGDIWAVWWAPGMTLWRANNLSALTGAPPMAGGLTAYVTPWGGINLAGLDAAGEVVVTWWVPKFKGNWAQSNLSNQFGHDGMGGMALTSYVTPWGGLNLAGLDADGSLVVYWWAPGMDRWIVSPLSSLIPGAALPTGELEASASPDGLVSIFGFSAEGELLRYHWQPGQSWDAESVTRDAAPVP